MNFPIGCIVAAVVSMSLPVSAADALPPPLSASEFAAILAECEFDANQTAQADAAFAAYSVATEAIVSDIYARYYEGSGKQDTNAGDAWLDPDPWKEIVASWRDACESMARADTQLFVELGALASNDQILRIERCRLRRERERLLGELFLREGRESVVDLTGLLRRLNVDLDSVSDASAILARYELSLTALERDLYRQTPDIFPAWVEAVRNGGMMEDNAALQQRNGHLYHACTEASGALDTLSSIIELNLRSWNQVQPFLTEGESSLLRREYLRSGYVTIFPLASHLLDGWDVVIESHFPDSTEASALLSARMPRWQQMVRTMMHEYDEFRLAGSEVARPRERRELELQWLEMVDLQRSALARDLRLLLQDEGISTNDLLAEQKQAALTERASLRHMTHKRAVLAEARARTFKAPLPPGFEFRSQSTGSG
ncbi:MAG: hypothetical protein ACR2GY_08855 [Phycisphaerales bacterium]